jgi:hypothetical protein
MRILRAGILVAVLVSYFFQTAGAADTNPPPKLTFELRDGSRVVGTSVEGNFKFHSELLGDLKLPVKDISSVDCTSNNVAKLTTVNGDVLTVSFSDPALKIKTGFGKIEVTTDSLHRLSITTAPSPVASRGLVFFWSGSEDTQRNIGTDPDTPARFDAGTTVMVSNRAALGSMQQTRQLTFEAWIKPNSIQGEFPVLLSKGGNQPPDAFGGYEFYLNGNGNNDLCFVSGERHLSTIGANGRLINRHLGEWIHVAFTLDDRTRVARFFVNGKPANDEDNNGIEEDVNFDVPNNLYIGSPDPASHPNRTWFDGEIRNVTLYNRVLTRDEIDADLEAQKPE